MNRVNRQKRPKKFYFGAGRKNKIGGDEFSASEGRSGLNLEFQLVHPVHPDQTRKTQNFFSGHPVHDPV
jgi:hypothetical protein